ncbi:tetratricopeptide repeat protein 39B-like [Cimex lectularius]|uniref:Tetratricopeptide repeat protein 39B n=1 Tax=Cimex lectularius TaxID=79782 RepID=A0A8I6S8W9_CIMLE|nr:tetratricopeptide repeat protein 39B-like [Cimex lectularius]
MEDSDEEIFEDAYEITPRNDNVLDLDTTLLECKLAVDLFFNNKFDDAKNVLAPWVGKSMYHTIGNAVFQFLEAMLTFDQQLIEKASEALKCSINLCNYYRKKHSFSESLGKIVKKSKYDHLSPEEIHAELCYAESLLLKSMLAFIEDETLVSFIKAGFKIRTCFNSYKECSNIMKSRDWSNEKHLVHFQSGVHVGIGSFNLMISLLPTRIIKLLEFIGFSGSKEVGINELTAGYRLTEGIRQVLSIMTLLTYNLIAVYVLSHNDGDLDLCEEILQQQLKLYPDGAWFLYFKGRLEFMKGNLEEANNWYIKSWKSQTVWPQFHHLCFWELMWTNIIVQNWKEATFYASSLLKESRWSRTIYGYQRVSTLLMMEKNTPEEEKEISTLILNIPQWRQRFAGKSLPMEKFCARKCDRYIAQKNFLVLPAIELLYVWNYFKILGKKWELCQNVYKLVLKSLSEFENGKYSGTEFEYDNKCLLLLLKGVCLFQMKSPLQAEQCLKTLIGYEKKIKQDLYLVPFALVELAIIYNSIGSLQKAISVLEDVKRNYTGYSLESRLHFRIHTALLDFNSKK